MAGGVRWPSLSITRHPVTGRLTKIPYSAGCLKDTFGNVEDGIYQLIWRIRLFCEASCSNVFVGTKNPYLVQNDEL